MSEYGIYSSQGRGYSDPQYASQPASNVEWYSSGSQQQQQYSNFNYHEQSFAASSGAQYGTFEDEAPLLEELGIDIPAILSRTKSILTFRLSGHDVDSLDLGGPLVYMACLGIAHLLVGKLHFGYILGWTIVGSGLIWFILGSITGHDGESGTLDLYSCCCLMGYSLLPLVLHAVGSLLLPRRSVVAMVFCSGGGDLVISNSCTVVCA
ncbi:hypothetical protein Ndes2526B_g04207 [Nannochloris sp. 'desiccata']